MGFNSSKSKSNNSSEQSSNSTSSSLNQAFPMLSGALGGVVGNAATGSNAIASLLGLGGAEAQTGAFDNFRNSSGYNFIQNEGINGITNSAASKGLLGSGSALKGIAKYSSGLASSFLDKYLESLTGLSNTGIQAGQILSSAGNTANSQSTSYGTSTGKSSSAGTGFQLG